MISERNATNHVPMLDCANACTELTTPLRVRNVPKIQSRKVQKTSHTFHTFIMPRFSCIITECRNAVPLSQGSSEAFSTGSQPQYPPQPSTAYAQCARVMKLRTPPAPGVASALNGLSTKLFSVRKKSCTPAMTTPT